MHTNYHLRFATLGLCFAVGLAGCKSSSTATPDDSSLNSQVHSRLSADQTLSGQPIQTAVANGVVTLTGTVSSDAARSAAAGDAAQVSGVRTVVNNLTVQAPPATAAISTPPAPVPQESVSRPAPLIRRRDANQPAPVVRNNPQPAQSYSPAPVQQPVTQVQTPPPPPPPPPAPVVRNITLAAGTAIPVRITQTLDSATTQTGDKFTGAVASDVIADGVVVLPQGTPVTGHVDEARDAAHFKGSSLLSISLTSISRRGDRITIATQPYSKEGEGRGKNTAEKAGGGAAVGAILGGIFGGGKGAAIGAAAGGGVGAGANTITRGQQVQIPSESVVRFKLSDPIILHVTSEPNSSRGSGDLERRNEP